MSLLNRVWRTGSVTNPKPWRTGDVTKKDIPEMADVLAGSLGGNTESDDYRMLVEIWNKKAALAAEQERMRELYDRFDNLYYADEIDEKGGADHWPSGKNTTGSGRVHVSVNVHASYVDIPAALQATTPIFNYMAEGPEPAQRAAAERREELFFRWWDDAEMDINIEDICRLKGLYGDSVAKVYWDADAGVPKVQLVEDLRGLYLGWGDSNFRRLDWAIYCYGLSPESVEQEYGVFVRMRGEGVNAYPWVIPNNGEHGDPLNQLRNDQGRVPTAYELLQVPIYDYWYKVPTQPGKPPTIWNTIYVGNLMVKPPTQHTEYDDLPYIIIPNNKVPRRPTGRSDLFDVEQILREKDERLTQAAAMINSIVSGQRWQLVGPEAPDEVPPNFLPQPNEVTAPGPGNEIRPITPFIPQFAVEDFLKRLDREAATITGMNDLMLGLAPAGTLGSSRAINALTANFVARIRPRRKILYRGLQDIWTTAAKVWERKDSSIRQLIDGHYRLKIEAPDLTPRDEMETAQRAINLVQNRLWSSERAMDATGVDDPADEKALIREEQTDATLNPAAVMTQMQLIALAAQFGAQQPQQGPGAQANPQQALNAQRTLNRPVAGTPSQSQPENAAQPPPETLPSNASAVSQTLLQGGETKGRIMTQQELG